MILIFWLTLPLAARGSCNCLAQFLLKINISTSTTFLCWPQNIELLLIWSIGVFSLKVAMSVRGCVDVVSPPPAIRIKRARDLWAKSILLNLPNYEPFFWRFLPWFFFSVHGNQPTLHSGGVSMGMVCGCCFGDRWHMACDPWQLTNDRFSIIFHKSRNTCENCASFRTRWEILCLPYTLFLEYKKNNDWKKIVLGETGSAG